MANIFKKLFSKDKKVDEQRVISIDESQVDGNKEEIFESQESTKESSIIECEAQENQATEGIDIIGAAGDVKETERTEEVQERIQVVEKPKGFLDKLKQGLSKTSNGIKDKVNMVLANFRKIDEELFEELEEMLIISDIGVITTGIIIENIKQKVKLKNIQDPNQIKTLLKDEIKDLLSDNDSDLHLDTKPSVILVIGVNGAGKTTSIGKIANQFKNSGKTVQLAAADTFRAAAIDQLDVWGKRVGIDVIKHSEGSDPSAVIFDAINSAKAKNTDILICDTAGRLHNKVNLMNELSKINKIIDRELPNSSKEVLLVVDATTGQNAATQAKAFSETTNLTGIILTKLDGTAKGGIILKIKSELNIPVKYIGIGEGIEDLQKFNSNDFVEALFEE